MSEATIWDRYDIGTKVEFLLSEVEYYRPCHHLGSPYGTPYQLAIMFKERFPEDFECIGLPVGGAGTGERRSLAQYLAGQLSRKMAKGDLPNIEGGFLSNIRLRNLSFNDSDGTIIMSALTGSQYDLSLFRLRSTDH